MKMSPTSRPMVRCIVRPAQRCGRTGPRDASRTINRKTTKIAAFCNWFGNTRVESCWTKPMVSPPQNAPTILPNAAEHDTRVHDDDELEADIRLERIVRSPPIRRR